MVFESSNFHFQSFTRITYSQTNTQPHTRTQVHADGRKTPSQDDEESKDKIDDDLSDSEDSDTEDFKRERVDTGALTRSLHESLECGHAMIQSILQNTNLISFKTQSAPSRKRLILEGYVRGVRIFHSLCSLTHILSNTRTHTHTGTSRIHTWCHVELHVEQQSERW